LKSYVFLSGDLSGDYMASAPSMNTFSGNGKAAMLASSGNGEAAMPASFGNS